MMWRNIHSALAGGTLAIAGEHGWWLIVAAMSLLLIGNLMRGMHR